MVKGVNKVRDRKGYINRQTYNDFVEKYPTTTITYQQFIQTLKQSNAAAREYILTNELGFKLPYNLGYIAVTKFKQKETYKVTDWKNTNILKKIIPLTNFHSFGWMFKIKMYKNKKITPLQVYQMTAHRIIKRMLAAKIKEGKQNYIELEHAFFNKRFAISSIFKDQK